MRIIDRTGQIYGRLTVVRRVENRSKHVYWLCTCTCGGTIETSADALRSGASVGCGCVRIDLVRHRSTTHGATSGPRRSREYKAWLGAKARCVNPASHRFKNYGARGIRMCAEWIDDYSAFLRDMGSAPNGKTLDRIDPNGNYEPSNCRWASTGEQARNRTNNVYVSYLGKRMVLQDLAEHVGVNYSSLHHAYRYRGEGLDDAIRRLRARGSVHNGRGNRRGS